MLGRFFAFAVLLISEYNFVFTIKLRPNFCLGKVGNREVVFCCDGWEYDVAKDECKPLCLYGCGAGECIAPNKCACKSPLIYQKYECLLPAPKCNEPCINSTCTSDNTCTCRKGYTHKDNFTCIPKCLNQCINADCVAPNKCLCREGYKNLSAWECEPTCGDCDNGTCISPNNCKCNEGYIKEAGKCVPKCDKTCSNGKCIGPNICECVTGYQMDPLDRFKCQPICNPTCVNATCTSPNHCTCLTGFVQVDSAACKPFCKHCDGGDCVAPNKCTCKRGYAEVNGECKPQCTIACVNGYCSAPETCTCYDRYELKIDNYTCQPVCTQKCINATCIEPDRCQCLEGFIESNLFTCKPICSCENGICISNICVCNEGFNMINGSCKPVCAPECVNGFCSKPNHCTCNDGYSRNETHPEKCFKTCIGCSDEMCDGNGECVKCQEGYQYHNHSCIPSLVDCDKCAGKCVYGECLCSDGRQCAVAAASTGLASLELTWIMGGCAVIIISASIIAIISYRWRKHIDYETKEPRAGQVYGSVAYTVPGTLKNRNYEPENVPNLYSDNENDEDEKQEPVSVLLPTVTIAK